VRASLSPLLSTCDLPRACDLVQIEGIDVNCRNPLQAEAPAQPLGRWAQRF
jgi:hypothetical protein